MHDVTAYAVFWVPKAYHFEPSGNDGGYEHVLEQFLRDVGGTPYYDILSQYSRAAHHRAVLGGGIQNRLRFGGAYIDRKPYPRSATAQYPLKPADWEAELVRLLNSTGWNSGPNALFILFLPADVDLCFDESSCTFDTGNGGGDCGSHSAFSVTSSPGSLPVIEAILPDSFSLQDVTLCVPLDADHSPHRDVIADSEVLVLSHELFEAVTDPGTDSRGAWYENGAALGEITDKCNALRGIVTLHGHRYTVQEQWSNADKGCVLTPPR